MTAPIDRLAACRHPVPMRVGWCSPGDIHALAIRQSCDACGSYRLATSLTEWGKWQRPLLVAAVVEQFEAPIKSRRRRAR